MAQGRQVARRADGPLLRNAREAASVESLDHLFYVEQRDATVALGENVDPATSEELGLGEGG